MPGRATVSAGIALAALGLTGCSGLHPGGAGEPKAFQDGYRAGRAARLDHPFTASAKMADVRAFCDLTGYADLRAVAAMPVQWSDGFDAGCLIPPPPRVRPVLPAPGTGPSIGPAPVQPVLRARRRASSSAAPPS